MLQRHETANLVVTVPRSAAPAAGYPLVVFVRTGGGGDRQLVDRGQQATEGGAAIEPGEGPARYLARAGFAADTFWIPEGLNNSYAILDFVSWCVSGSETGGGYRYDTTAEGEIH